MSAAFDADGAAVNEKLPDNVYVDYGEPAPGSSNPMPAEVLAAYEERIRLSVEALADGARLAGTLWIG